MSSLIFYPCLCFFYKKTKQKIASKSKDLLSLVKKKLDNNSMQLLEGNRL